MRVLHIIGGLGPGGAETLLARMAMSGGEVEHHVLCLGPREWYSERLEAAGVAVHHLNLQRFANVPAAPWRIARIVRRTRPDLIQGWMYRANVIASVVGKLARVPSVWSIHSASLGPVSLGGRAWALAGGLMSRWPATIINCSKRSAAVHEGYGYGRGRVEVVPNGYDPQAFAPDPEGRRRARQALGIADDEFLVGSVTRWHAEKDIPMLLAALRRLLEARPSVRIFLAGNLLEESHEPFRTALRDAGLDGRLLALGRRSDLPDLYRAADAHVLASRTEAFPNVLGEAMLSGTPCVVTDVGDCALIVGEMGWVAPPQDADALAVRLTQAFDQWATDRNGYAERRAAARARIVDHFTLERMISAYREVWSRALARSPRGVGASR